MTTIAVLGSITRDRILITKKNLDFSQPGGAVYYASRTLASLGVNVIAIPLLAKQDEALLRALQHPKIQILPQWTCVTTCYQNTYPADSLDICEKKILSMTSDFSISKNLFEAVRSCGAIHLAPLSSQECHVDLFKTLRKNYSGIISIDGQGFTRGPQLNVQTLLTGNIDIIKVDEEESAALGCLVRWGIPEVLITKASRGSTVFFEGRAHEVRAYPAQKIVDATGCGDAYMAGYLKQRLVGADPVKAADFAARIGAKNLECKGALS